MSTAVIRTQYLLAMAPTIRTRSKLCSPDANRSASIGMSAPTTSLQISAICSAEVEAPVSPDVRDSGGNSDVSMMFPLL
jgi:hypothetical protein